MNLNKTLNHPRSLLAFSVLAVSLSAALAQTPPQPKASAVTPAASPATSTTASTTTKTNAAQGPAKSASATTTKPAAKPAQRAPAPGGAPNLVWVNEGSKVYHCHGTRHYGTTLNGKYMSEADAKAQGKHGPRNKDCSAAVK